jgi:hypothetical protein
VILLAIVIVLLLGAIAVQLWYWRNAVSLGVELPRTLKVIMGINIAVLTAAVFGVAWFGYNFMAAGEM